MDQQPTTTATLGTSALKAAVSRYHKAMKNYEGQEVDFEMGLRGAFHTNLHSEEQSSSELSSGVDPVTITSLNASWYQRLLIDF